MLHPYVPLLVLIVGVAMTRVQHLAVGCAEPHEVLWDVLLKPFTFSYADLLVQIQ